MTFEEAWDRAMKAPNWQTKDALRRFALEVMGEAFWAEKDGLKAKESVRVRIEALR
ncbi:hypothetical protein LCGC14_2998860 [marine sediment metagenome]|uniref:Uncharacterized protein n=1 Tax=marine sediment metagenome TaxID=412755 RepID=A0A0F8ZSS8_9ZZZZ